ncbi:MAG TPA: cytochrome c [Bdellovibrionales bacterium]|nr:hypothetical protein [Pseudobdellovibrionaceae bacterium]HAG92260.1 cytochrome c [Bdellovibrionales bacterium]|tara:strand:+ start:441 stop:980 length:540 start_codon:yes stop_codon:yes gene_type:complete
MKRLSSIAALFLLVGCNGGKNQTNIELVTNMMDQQSVKSQDWVPEDGDKLQMRQPPEGTVPRGFYVYPYPNDPEASANLKNPHAGDFSPELLAQGQKMYDIYCAVCHGHGAKGDGTVAEKMPLRPPSLLTDKVRNFSDGRIFHIVTRGQGVMGSYSSQIVHPDDRWAVVNYIRSLQKGN